MRARALAKVAAMLVLAELLYWNAALVIGTLGKVGRAACMGFPVEGKRKARSAVAGGLGGLDGCSHRLAQTVKKEPMPLQACQRK
jgi:hypothetical protein